MLKPRTPRLKGAQIMTKKIAIGMLLLWFSLPATTNAHTALKNSNPAANQVVTEHLIELVLTYEGEVESLSTMTLQKENQDIPLTAVEIQTNQMIGHLEKPLENGAYIIKWEIVGEDGHIITGDIPFTVQNTSEEITEPEEGAASEEGTTDTSDETETEENASESNDETTNEQRTTHPKDYSAGTLTKIIIPLAALSMVGVGLFALFGRKK